jgi:glycosyltransferase involved in cell wall biosynthesis
LVIVGQSAVSPAINHPWNQDLIWLQQQKSPWLRLIGPVSKIDKKYLYNLATIYCQPSLAEGFGLPVVEAMKCGCPVVYSQESSLPEIMYFSGEYFDPYHPDSLRLALEKIWTNSSCRKQLIASGLKRVQVFNWQYTALQTLAVYQLALIDHQK